MVCPLCGKKSEVGLFCAECYLKKNLVLEVPSVIGIDACRNCNRQLLGGRWKEGFVEESAVKKAVEDSIKSNVKGLGKAGALNVEIEKRGKEYLGKVSVELGDFSEERQTIVRINKSSCPDCSRMAGGYFEAVLQLRGGFSKGRVERIIKDIQSFKDRHSFISEIRKVPGGYDMYLGSKKSAEKIVKQFKEDAEIKRSFKQAGFDKQKGKPLNRFYYLIRI